MLWTILNWLRKKHRVRLPSRATELRRFRPFLEVLEQRELLNGSLPTVTDISPDTGPQVGGTTVTINGTNLAEVTGVDFGSTPATSFSYNSTSNYITAVSPAELPGLVNVVLLASGIGNSPTTSEDQFTFAPTDTSTSLSASADPATPGQSVTFTAAVSSTGGTPTWTVTFEDGSTVLGSGTLSSGPSGAVATFTTSSLASGFHSIIAVYGGNTSFTGSSSATLSEAVQPVGTTTSVSASANPAAPGQSVTLTATVMGTNEGTPTGKVTFLDGSTTLGSATLDAAASGAQATLSISSLTAGSHAITAVYDGDSTFASSTSASINETVQPESTASALVSSTDPAPLNQSVTFTATVSGANGGTPTGTVTFEDGSTVLGTATLSTGSSGTQATFATSSLTAGSHTITAVYGGDSTFAGSSASLAQVVGQSNLTSTSTSLFASASQVAPGQSVAFTATVTAADGGTPTGTVTFLDGSTVLDTISLSAASSGGQVVFGTTSLASGAHSITAVYSGDDNYAGSTSANTITTVQLVSSSIALSSSANPAEPGQSLTLTATVSGADGGTPTGTVTFLDGSTTLGTATLSGTNAGMQATFTTSSLANGTHSLIAEYGGD